MAKKYYVESLEHGKETGFVMEVDTMAYYSDESRYKPIGKAEYERKTKARSLEMLHKHVKKGDTVYCVLRHVSVSGMSRRIDFYAIGEDRKPVYLSGYISQILSSAKRHKSEQGLVINGCGMDMGFHVVYNLASVMFPDEERGGYALKHEWL